MIHNILAIIAITSLLTGSLTIIGVYSNETVYAKKCTTINFDETSSQNRCFTQGKNPSIEYEICYDVIECNSSSTFATHKWVAQSAVDDQQYCKQALQKQGIDCSTSNGR